MKKSPSKVKASIFIYFAGVTSFLSKAMGSDYEPWLTHEFQSKYGVVFPVSEYPMTQDTSSLSSFLSSSVVKGVEIALVVAVFVIGIISFFKIRNIDDKTQREKKIRNTIIILAILVSILIALFVIPARLLTR